MKFVLVAAAMVAALCVGCGTKRNAERCLEGLCSDPDLPFCDIDGTVSGEPNSCIAVECTPGEVAGCRDDRALTCNTAGDNYDLVDCPYGCDANGCKPCDTPECAKHIVPRYLPSVCDQLAEGDPVTITQDTTIDTTNELSCSSVVSQVGSVDICVLRYSALTVEANRTLAIKGTRAVAIVVDHDLTVAGIVDVGATGSTNGPGGGAVRSGTCTGTSGGCGGAGYLTAGGSGGGSGSTNNGGAAETNPAALTELRGGTRPNSGGIVYQGGGGGGATLISCRGAVTVSGLVDANGGGGGGDLNTIPYRQAGGGGSGGTVVLQGMTVMATGQFYANGGGGGGACNGGCSDGTLVGRDGGDGQRSVAQYALGGAAPGGAVGGSGGTRNTPPHDGAQHPTNPANGGGGGGSIGCFLVYGRSPDPC